MSNNVGHFRILTHGLIESLNKGFKFKNGKTFCIFLAPKSESADKFVLVNCRLLGDMEPSVVPVNVGMWSPLAIVELEPDSKLLNNYTVYWGGGKEHDFIHEDAVPTPELNEIWYWAVDDRIIAPNNRFADANGNILSIVSNEIVGGKGVLTFSGEVAKITGAAWTGMNRLVGCYIPDHITEMGNSVFENCVGLELVEIGAGMTQMGYGVFRGCTSLVEMIVRAEVPPTVFESTFANVPDNCVIKVPSASVDTYKAAAVWSSRAEYITSI